MILCSLYHLSLLFTMFLLFCYNGFTVILRKSKRGTTMKKIILTGAGYGAFTCSFLLARAGYDVTVYEKSAQHLLGQDWYDPISLSDFTKVGLQAPPQEELLPPTDCLLHSPSGLGSLRLPKKATGNYVSVNQRFLKAFLTAQCKAAGVKFCFDTECLEPIVDRRRVTGLKVRQQGKKLSVFGDLVIDCCGAYSPIKANLPNYLGVTKTAPEEPVFHSYCISYQLATAVPTSDKEVFLYPNGTPLLLQTLTYGTRMDCLVGSSQPLTLEIVQNALSVLQKKDPGLCQDKTIQENYFDLPLGTPQTMFLAEGYAAVGDSVGMANPLTGSGSSNAMQAGTVLAQVILSVGKAPLTKQSLWPYEQQIFHSFLKNAPIYSSFYQVLQALDYLDFNLLLDNICFDFTSTHPLADGLPVSLRRKLPALRLLLHKSKPELKTVAEKIIKSQLAAAILPKEYNVLRISLWQVLY